MCTYWQGIEVLVIILLTMSNNSSKSESKALKLCSLTFACFCNLIFVLAIFSNSMHRSRLVKTRSMSEVQLEVRSNSKASSLGSGEILRMASGVISGGHTPTPTWTEGTPSFTESSSSGELGMKIDFIGLALEPVYVVMSFALLKGFQDRRK